MSSRRRAARGAFGAMQVVLAAVFLAVFAAGIGPTQGVSIVLFVVSGLLFVVAGVRDHVTVAGRAVRWQQLDGIGTLILAGACVVGITPMARMEPIFAGTIVAGAVALGFLGYQEMVDGPHVDPTADPSRQRLLLIVAIVAASIGGGVLLAFVGFS
jgi:hypothetical protein